MDWTQKWDKLPREPSLKKLTDPDYGKPGKKQHPPLQDITRAHIESFNQAMTEGLFQAVQVRRGEQRSLCFSCVISLHRF